MAKSDAEKKAAQAAAHKRWRESEKGKAYKAAYEIKRKAKQAQEAQSADAVNTALTSQVGK